mgnify:CR=1 FL=1
MFPHVICELLKTVLFIKFCHKKKQFYYKTALTFKNIYFTISFLTVLLFSFCKLK